MYLQVLYQQVNIAHQDNCYNVYSYHCIMPKTTRTPSINEIADVSQCKIQQLTRLPAQVLRLPLSSCNLTVTGLVVFTMLYISHHQARVTHTSTTATQSVSSSSPTISSPLSASTTHTSILQAIYFIITLAPTQQTFQC